MNVKWSSISPENGAVIWRTAAILALTALWLSGEAAVEGFILLMILAVLAIARMRFNLPVWTVLADQLACMAVVPFWPAAWFAMAIPVFESVMKGKVWYSLPVLIFFSIYPLPSLTAVTFILQALIAGWFLRCWRLQLQQYRIEADRERHDRYELEKLKTDLLEDSTKSAQMAELAERNRIARELHDHVGHELTGASLAMQAFEQLWQDNNPQAEHVFSQVKTRLEDSVVHMREAVHDMKPEIATGAGRLERICETFTACPLNFTADGNIASVPAHLWSILEPVLKEGLTNITKHSNGDHASVDLDVSRKIVRLSVYDNGTGTGNTGEGMGLRNLRYRAKAVGGTVSFSAVKDGARLVCVLPLQH